MTNVDPKKIIRHGEYEKRWTFITNHAAVLSLLAKHPRITAREVSREVGITEHSVRLIVSDLDQGGYISKIREGEVSDIWWTLSGPCAIRRSEMSP